MYISSFTISGYRSLKNVRINGMLPICIFHGLNNSGKSNILSALETIFRRKVDVEETTVDQLTRVDQTTKVEHVTEQHERKGSFWRGRITEFRDNFYLNRKGDISFSVSVTFLGNELAHFKDLLKRLKPFLAEGGHNKILKLDGRMRYLDDDTAEMVLEGAVFNNHHVVFQVDKSGKKLFFPRVKDLTDAERITYFEGLMDLLSDSFALLPCDRYLSREHETQDSGGELLLTSKTFKQWLLKLSLSRSGHEAFEEIKNMFASEPFSFGEIGFSKERDEVEIMVKDRDVRLPVSRHGSGHQQILYIIGNLVLNKGKMVGIEELEINLSPLAQKIVFEKLKHHIYKTSDLINQIIITSHSDYFEGRRDVRCYGVEHDGFETKVNPWSKSHNNRFFSHSPRRRLL